MASMRFSLLAALLVLGCSADPPEDAPEPTLASIQVKVFTPRCSEPGCHGIDFPRQGLALYNEEVALSTTIDKPPTIGDASEFYRAIIAPGDPDQSFLVAKITSPRSNHGLRMPQSGDTLGPRTIEAIRTWIARMPK